MSKDIARMALSRLEKRAGFALPLIPAATGLAGRAAVATARGTGEAAKGVGGLLWRAAKAQPLTTGLTIATTPLMLGALKGDPAAKAEAKNQTRYYASQVARPGRTGNVTYACVYSREELEAAAAVRRQLEKTAAARGRGGPPPFRGTPPPPTGARPPGRPPGAYEQMLRQVVADEMQKNMPKMPKAPAKKKAISKLLPIRKWPIHRIFAAGLALGAAHAVSQHAAAGLSYGVGKAVQSGRDRQRGTQWNAVLKADPGLGREPLAKNYFEVLHRASPYIASEPVIAAATVRSMVETPSLSDNGVPAVTPKVLKDIIDVEKTRQETRFPWMRSQGGPSKLPTNVFEAG